MSLTPRTRMIDFVRERFDAGLPDLEIRDAAISAFRLDQEMVSASLDFMAQWALSDSQAIYRRRAARRILRRDVSVFEGLEEYLAPIDDGRLLSILDVPKIDILNFVAERRPVVEGEIRHLDCIEAIAKRLPSDNATPRQFFDKKQNQLFNIIHGFYGGEVE